MNDRTRLFVMGLVCLLAGCGGEGRSREWTGSNVVQQRNWTTEIPSLRSAPARSVQDPIAPPPEPPVPPEAPPPPPAAHPGAQFLVLDAAAENAVPAIDGARVTSLPDLSLGANDLEEGASGKGPVYRQNVGGEPCLEFTDGWLRSKALASVASGTGREFFVTMVIEARDRLRSGSQYWAWSNSAASGTWLALRHTGATALHPEFLQSSDTGPKPTLQSSEPLRGTWHVLSLRRRAHSVQIRLDGVAQPEQASELDAITLDTFALNAIATQIPMIGGDWRLRRIRMYSEAPDDGEALAIEQEIAALGGLAWKGQLGAQIGSPLVFGMLGQSNSEGQTEPPFHQVTSRDAWMLALDGQLRTLAEPSHDGGNQSTGEIIHEDPHHLGSYASAFADRLRAHVPNPIIIVPASKASTPSMSWAIPGQTLNTLLSAAKHRLHEVLKARGAKIGTINLYQGESNTSNLTEADQWLVDMRGILNDLDTEFAGSFASPTHFVLVILPSTPYVSSDAASWERVRVNAQRLAAERTDTVTIQAPNTTAPFLHLRGPEEDALGEAIADRIGPILAQ